MNIGQFGEAFIPIYDGVGRVMKAYADTMAKRGHDVYVIAPMYDAGFRGQYPYEIVDYLSFKFSHKLPYRVGLKHLDPHFIQRLKQIDLDICHVHGPVFAGHIGLSYAKKKHVPIVGSFHTKFYDDILEVTKSKQIARTGAKMVASFYSQCDEVWAVTQSAGETLREYGYKGKFIVMPNGTDRRVLKSSLIPSVKEKYNIKENVPMLLYVGQINWKKNLKCLIETCGLIKKKGFSNFQLVLAGQGPDGEGVKRLAKKCGLEDIIIFTGHLQNFDELDCLYYLSDLFFFPSIYDTSSLVLREAASQHTPTLVVENTAAAEVIVDMKNGLTAPEDENKLSDKIISYFALSEDEKKRIGDEAYKTIPLPWDGELMDSILSRYSDLIEKYKGKRIY